MNSTDSLFDKMFFLAGFVMIAIVAINPDWVIRGLTLGRVTSRDVNMAPWRKLQIVAGIGAVSYVVLCILSGEIVT